MTRDDIIRMAREAFGAPYSSYLEKRSWDINDKQVEHFAALVAAAERDACAKVCIEVGATKGCSYDALDMADYCAAAIRARGEK